MFLLDLLKPTLTTFHFLKVNYQPFFFLQFHQVLLHTNLEYLNLIYFNKDIYWMAMKCVNVKEMHIAGDYYEYKTNLENLIIDLLQKFTKLK
jgi:hypothetical protein